MVELLFGLVLLLVVAVTVGIRQCSKKVRKPQPTDQVKSPKKVQREVLCKINWSAQPYTPKNIPMKPVVEDPVKALCEKLSQIYLDQ